MVVKRCTAITVLGMLNQAAQKFTFTLEKITMGLGRGTRARCALPPMYSPLPYKTAANVISSQVIRSFIIQKIRK